MTTRPADDAAPDTASPESAPAHPPAPDREHHPHERRLPRRPPASAPATRGRIETAPDPRDLPGDFAHRRTIEVRFADTDAMGHVNNAVYLTYCETARVTYWSEVTGEPIALGSEGAESLILAEARITYRAPAFHGELVTVETRATRLGRSSFSLDHRLTAAEPDGPARLVAISESILVRYDYRRDVPVPVPPGFAEAIEAFEGRSLRTG